MLICYSNIKSENASIAAKILFGDPRLSPIYGDQSNLHRIKIFVSAHELFYADCILFIEKAAAAANTSVHLSVKKNMVHDWVILPLQERDDVLKEMASFL